MVDKDTKEISAIQQVFPETAVLICWFHVLLVWTFFYIKTNALIHLCHKLTEEIIYSSSYIFMVVMTNAVMPT